MTQTTATCTRTLRAVSATALLLAFSVCAVEAQTTPQKPWQNRTLSPDQRASLLEKELTLDERLSLLHGPMAIPFSPGMKLPKEAIGSAGYIPGVPRLGIPAQQESDASLGVTNPGNVRPGDTATALPSSLLLAATFNTDLAYKGGVVVGQEARSRGINVQLAGGVNLARDPRGGRNFEYVGEDPLLAGHMAGAAIKGIQSQNLIATMKHFAVNDQETGRNFANSVISEAAMRESDLLAFQIAYEVGQPGSVMCAYNLVNGAYACGNDFLLNKVLKTDWGFKGYVMSDWGAVKATDFALKGLDQQSGEQLDKQVWFGDPLKAAVQTGIVPASRVSDMSRRILRSMFAAGLFDAPAAVTVDRAANGEVSRQTAAEGIVLLKNDGNLLPLAASAKTILVVGGHADAGVLSGGGSSQVTADAAQIALPVGGEGMMAAFNRMNFHPSSPLQALKERLPHMTIRFDTGRYTAEAVRKAKEADLVIVFGNQWMAEGEDAPDLSLPNGQDALIAALAEANPKTVVVLQTGGAVAMPWLKKTPAVLAAWYSGDRGGEAIADVLTGKVNPSGHLPVTFPTSISHYPRADLPGLGLPDGQVFDVVYDEGADVGYRRFAALGQKALFPFGYGLSYTRFAYSDVKVTGGDTLSVSFKVTNTGSVRGKDAPQVYLNHMPDGPAKRLIAFSKVDLAPGQSTTVTLSADMRLLSRFDAKAQKWMQPAGRYDISVAQDAEDTGLTASAQMKAATRKP
ncbi:glycoside hydrolase family 3 C-terminal domain-containing protein [Asticcacaulis excentricus]|uniref:Glycoside hydrolase family 3 domain protein n=1 Tax=Asticcacaulis excentricus (strain ATCC 15261 / DSM 4724 / KCTC 12464 / NCIMB 9791 / VKM B-1370 / CB 48) TaxID=573065 RepID=E8RU64_ASTEC|nr:glycoside hydrolase family 3 C-terminal domain-containing protein [Asticcacaulis excentricus]ADU15035.1 glycoside hydrolase family 3 domain protein [Asticcacaulis excentricus CB 48]